MTKFKVLFLSLFLISSLQASYENDDDSLGNIALQVGIWNLTTNGLITNESANGNTDYKKDLGYKEDKVVNTFSVDLKNDTSWLPNVNLSYFRLNNSATNTINGTRTIDVVNDMNGSLSSNLLYQEVNMIFYGFLYQGPIEFDFGLNIKKIDFSQKIRENSGFKRNLEIKGPDSILVLPYMALKFNIDFINTVLMAQTSILSFGDNEAKDYMYSINYRVMKNIYLSYGYKYNSFKTTNSKNTNEIYDINIKGNYISCKVLF